MNTDGRRMHMRNLANRLEDWRWRRDERGAGGRTGRWNWVRLEDAGGEWRELATLLEEAVEALKEGAQGGGEGLKQASSGVKASQGRDGVVYELWAGHK